MKKPPFIPGMFGMDHVPPPDPDNFWWLDLNDPRVVMVDDKLQPTLTLTVREIKDGKVALQITTSPTMKQFRRQ